VTLQAVLNKGQPEEQHLDAHDVQFLLCEMDKAERFRLRDMKGAPRRYPLPVPAEAPQAVAAKVLAPHRLTMKGPRAKAKRAVKKTAVMKTKPLSDVIVVHRGVRFALPNLYCRKRGATCPGDKRYQAVMDRNNYCMDERLVCKKAPSRANVLCRSVADVEGHDSFIVGSSLAPADLAKVTRAQWTMLYSLSKMGTLFYGKKVGRESQRGSRAR